MRTVFNRFALEVNIDFMHAFSSENGYGFWMKLFFFFIYLWLIKMSVVRNFGAFWSTTHGGEGEGASYMSTQVEILTSRNSSSIFD